MSQFRPGTLIADRYRLMREVGAGAIGVVYEAEHVFTSRHFAVKVPKKKWASKQSVANRFIHEARSAARLLHPNIVAVIDVGRTKEGIPYLVQELLDGQDLGKIIQRRGRIRLSQALSYVLPIMDALALAHDHQIVHRDIKPSNIMLCRNPGGGVTPKLVDFGFAKFIGDSGVVGATRRGALVGTPRYMAPEQVMGEPDIDGRADIWGVAVTLFELVAGRPAVLGETVYEVLNLILARPVPALSSLIPEVTNEFDQALALATRHDRNLRYGDMRAFAEALKPIALQNELVEAAFSTRSGSANAGRNADATLPMNRGSSFPGPVSAPPPKRREDFQESDEEMAARSSVALSSMAVAPFRWRIGLVMTTQEVERSQIADCFSAALEARCDIFRYLEYENVVQALLRGDIDFAWLPPMAYVRAQQLGGARLLVTPQRAGNASYAAALLARKDRVKKLEDLQDLRAVWVDAWSAAGYLVPRAILRKLGIDLRRAFKSEAFVGSHGAVLAALRQNRADVGGTFCTINNADGKVVGKPWRSSDGVRILTLSKPIPSDAFCASLHVAEEDAREVERMLLSREQAEPVLHMLGATAFTPGMPGRYARLERMLKRVNELHTQ